MTDSYDEDEEDDENDDDEYVSVGGDDATGFGKRVQAYHGQFDRTTTTAPLIAQRQQPRVVIGPSATTLAENAAKQASAARRRQDQEHRDAYARMQQERRALEKRWAALINERQSVLRHEINKRRDMLMHRGEQLAGVTFEAIERAFHQQPSTSAAGGDAVSAEASHICEWKCVLHNYFSFTQTKLKCGCRRLQLLTKSTRTMSLQHHHSATTSAHVVKPRLPLKMNARHRT
jgi:hypothetical protein